jgi:hypothetical protein
VTVFDSATAPTFAGAVVTAGAAMAPAVKAANAAIIVNVVFIVFFVFQKRNSLLFQLTTIEIPNQIAPSIHDSLDLNTIAPSGTGSP